MRPPRVLVALCVAFMTPGCAAIFDGTTQQISINTTPSEARCKLMRLGAPIGEVSSTPGAVTIQKTKNDITIVCSKSGFVDATYMNHSGVAGATFANILGGVITGGIAWGIDSASGADNKYEGQVNVTLLPVSSMPPSGPEDPPAPQPQVVIPPTVSASRSVPTSPTSPPTTAMRQAPADAVNLQPVSMVHSPGAWTARTVLMADRSAGSCSKVETIYSFNFASDTLTADNPNGRMFSIPIPPDGTVKHAFKSSSGASLEIEGSALTRNLEIINPAFGCRWKLAES